MYNIFNLAGKLSTAFAASIEAIFVFLRGSYSRVAKFKVNISLLVAVFTFLKKPCPVLSPNQFCATIFPNQLGSVNVAFASSFGQFSATPAATFTKVSIPTTSAVLKVADFGRPKIGPVKDSTSSMVNPIFSMICNTLIMLKTPTLLAINAGVSLHKTVVLPKNTSP